MLRRSSASTEEDDSDQLRASPVRRDSGNDQRKSFTSAKFDVARNSATLDRRKVEKALESANGSQNELVAEPTSYEDSGKEKQEQHILAAQSATATEMESKEWKRSRPKSPWRCSLLTLLTTLGSILVLVFIVNSFFTKQLDCKGCRMSYMRPAFAKLHDFDTEHTRFASKYSVYLYRELGVDEDTKVRPIRSMMVISQG